MSGETFAEEISRIRPASVLIVLDNKTVEHKESIQLCRVSYMIKPFIISDLVDKITAIFSDVDIVDQHCSQMSGSQHHTANLHTWNTIPSIVGKT